MRVGFVVQRYGLEVCGGAELHCRQIAELMARRWQVEVFTTCAVDYTTWANYYRPGTGRVDSVRVRRFPIIRPREKSEFDRASLHVLLEGHTRQEEEAWMQMQGPWAPGLFAALHEARTRLDCFIFFTYLYCSTFFGLQEVRDRALLVPTAHDEPPLRLSIFQDLFQMPRGFIFNTPEERDLVHTRFGNRHIPWEVVGVGVSPPGPPDSGRFRRKYDIAGPFLLYVGRVDPAKQCDHLVQDYLRFREGRPEAPGLVLLGQRFMELPQGQGVRALGFVSDQDKFDALAGAEVLVLPSAYESLSMAVLEAWSVGTPVLVNGGCAVLVGQCRRAQAGLWYTGETEFAAALDYLHTTPASRKKLGENGRRYVRSNYSWQAIEEKYRRIAAKALPQLADRV